MRKNEVTWKKSQEHKIFENSDPELIKRFKEFHSKNKLVFWKFYEIAYKARQKGFKTYSQWLIAAIIRHDQNFKTKGDVFKINNDFIALYARLLIFKFPVFKDFFEFRELKPVRRSSDHQRQLEAVRIPRTPYRDAEA